MDIYFTVVVDFEEKTFKEFARSDVVDYLKILSVFVDHHANFKIIISENKFLAFKYLPFLCSVKLIKIFFVQSSVDKMALWLFEKLSCCKIHLLIFCSGHSGVIGSLFR